jgi:hypothetical protein
MCRSSLAGAILAASVISMSAACANAQQFQAPVFTGFEELGPLGAGETGNILSRGQGTLMLNMNQQAESLTYTLTYSGLSNKQTVERRKVI